jgi:hypothetical protein
MNWLGLFINMHNEDVGKAKDSQMNRAVRIVETNNDLISYNALSHRTIP